MAFARPGAGDGVLSDLPAGLGPKHPPGGSLPGRHVIPDRGLVVAGGWTGRPVMVPPSLLAASRVRQVGRPIRDPEHGEHLYGLATILPAPWPGHPLGRGVAHPADRLGG